MSEKHNFALLADYNRWINDRMYTAAASLSAEALVKDQGAFFKSILGTLNHILVADLLWLKRFAGHPAGFTALDPIRAMTKPVSLNQSLYDSLDALRAVRIEVDAAIIGFIEQASAKQLDSVLEYQSTQGASFRRKLSWLLLHFFNHQTHHRGQVSTLLLQQGIDVGVTDLAAMLPLAE